MFFSFSIISLLIHLEFHILRPNSIHLPLLLYLPLSPTAPSPKEKKANKETKSYLFFIRLCCGGSSGIQSSVWSLGEPSPAGLLLLFTSTSLKFRERKSYLFHHEWGDLKTVIVVKNGAMEMNNGAWFIEIFKILFKRCFSPLPGIEDANHIRQECAPEKQSFRYCCCCSWQLFHSSALISASATSSLYSFPP